MKHASYGMDRCTHPDGCHWYILQPGKGFQFHTWDFIRGYVTGWCSVNPPGSGSDADEAEFDCAEGPSSAGWMVGHTIRSGGE